MNVNGFPLAGSQEFPDNSFLITLNDPSNSLFEADSIRQDDLQLEIDGSLNPRGSLKLNTNDPDAPSFSFLRMLLEPASPLQFPQPQEQLFPHYAAQEQSPAWDNNSKDSQLPSESQHPLSFLSFQFMQTSPDAPVFTPQQPLNFSFTASEAISSSEAPSNLFSHFLSLPIVTPPSPQRQASSPSKITKPHKTKKHSHNKEIGSSTKDLSLENRKEKNRLSAQKGRDIKKACENILYDNLLSFDEMLKRIEQQVEAHQSEDPFTLLHPENHSLVINKKEPVSLDRREKYGRIEMITAEALHEANQWKRQAMEAELKANQLQEGLKYLLGINNK